MFENIRLSFRGIWSHKMRSFLTMLGMIVGVGSVIAIMAIGAGAQSYIFKELETDLGCRVPNNGCLKPWAEQGVLLLNTVLTVRAHAANSHRGQGWEIFTDKIIALLNAREKPMAFILWGGPARRKKSMITNPQHFIVESPHPSPLSAYQGFFGSRPFSRVNAFLEEKGQTPIDWQLPDL